MYTLFGQSLVLIKLLKHHEDRNRYFDLVCMAYLMRMHDTSRTLLIVCHLYNMPAINEFYLHYCRDDMFCANRWV